MLDKRKLRPDLEFKLSLFQKPATWFQETSISHLILSSRFDSWICDLTLILRCKTANSSQQLTERRTSRNIYEEETKFTRFCQEWSMIVIVMLFNTDVVM